MPHLNKLPSQELVKSLFDYNPDTGIFTRLLRPDTTRINKIFNTRWGGKPTEKIVEGRMIIGFNKRNYFANRLAWLYMYGEDPGSDHYIDHINCDKNDNRIANLRLATIKESAFNRAHRAPRNHNPYTGVNKTESGKWSAKIAAHYKQYYLGVFDTPEEARDVRNEKAKELFGRFANV